MPLTCQGCSSPTPELAKFCPRCGASLMWKCLCGSDNRTGDAFCTQCRARNELVAGSRFERQPKTSPGAELRQLSVLFCDLVGSTELSLRLDVEDLREVIADYHSCIAAVAERHGGFVAHHLGDGLMIYFGWPHAREHDPECAVRAGLAIVAAAAALEAGPLAAGSLQVRVGVATGPVVVGDRAGDGSGGGRGVVGETPNLAARLQGLAKPNSLVVAEGTKELTGSLFDYRDLGPQSLKGYSVPVHAWVVLRERSVESRFEALRQQALPLVGRGEQMQALVSRWNEVKAGCGRVVLLSGEPGIGKSRLAAALLDKLRPERHVRIQYVCAPHYRDSVLHPVIDQIERAAGFQGDTDQGSMGKKLRRLLAPGKPSAGDAGLIGKMVGVRAETEAEGAKLTPLQERLETFDALLGQLQRRSLKAPIVALVEDIHWADATTLDLLALAVERIGSMCVLLLVTARPDVPVSWLGQPEVSMLLVNRLGRLETMALIGKVTGGRTLPSGILEQIAARSDGVPLFVEEITKTVLDRVEPDQARRSLDGVEAAQLVPSTLQASLMARLDRLGAAKEIAQIGAVIGREFSFDLIQRLSAVAVDGLSGLLGELATAGLIAVTGRPPEAAYIFKHALVQDAAYGSLLRDRRRALHRRLAELLEQQMETPEILALHFGQARLPEKAVDYYLKAAHRAAERCAVAEMVSHLRQGLRQAEELPHSPERKRRELALQIALGRGLIDNKGSASEEGRTAFVRARELSLELGETEHRLSILYGLQIYHFTRSQPEQVLTYAKEMLDVGSRTGDRQAVLTGERVAGSAYLLKGQFRESRSAYEHLLELYDDSADSQLASDTTRDPKVAACAFLGIGLSAQGWLRDGAAYTATALRHAETLRHPISIVFALRRGCIQRMMQRDVAGTAEYAERLLTMSGTFETFLGHREGLMFQAWAGLTRRLEPGLLEQLTEVLQQLDDERMWAMLPYFMATGAELMMGFGERAQGAMLVERAHELISLTSERWCEPEILRLRALLGAHGSAGAETSSAGAEAMLLRSLAIAREQDAKLWELRSATSLAEHLRGEGRPMEARGVLEGVVGWFAANVDSPDLRRARTVLHELRRESPDALSAQAVVCGD